MAAVGRVASIGQLYDVRREQFIGVKMIDDLPGNAITSTQTTRANIKFTSDNSLDNKFTMMDISASLKLSILGGLFKLEGSGKYFEDSKKTSKSEKVTMIQSASTCYEALSITDKKMNDSINWDVLDKVEATHVVVGIQWGGDVFVSVENQESEEGENEKVEGHLGIEFNKLAFAISGQADVPVKDEWKKKFSEFNFELFGDILPKELPNNIVDSVVFCDG